MPVSRPRASTRRSSKGRRTVEQLMTLAQVADILQVSQRTVFRLIERGELTGAKVGREWRFTREDLEIYLGKARGGGAGDGTS